MNENWQCPPDTEFEIRALTVWGRARYLSFVEAPYNIKKPRGTLALAYIGIQMNRKELTENVVVRKRKKYSDAFKLKKKHWSFDVNKNSSVFQGLIEKYCLCCLLCTAVSRYPRNSLLVATGTSTSSMFFTQLPPQFPGSPVARRPVDDHALTWTPLVSLMRTVASLTLILWELWMFFFHISYIQLT